jgi:hypothetical protein
MNKGWLQASGRRFPRRLMVLGTTVLMFALLAAGSAPLLGAAPRDLNPPPIGQPASFRTFGRPIGGSFEVSMDAQPRELRMDGSLTWTITIVYKGDPGEAPQRAPRAPDLPESFTDSFDVKMTEEIDGNTWRFTYRLTPTAENVDRIPSLLLFAARLPHAGNAWNRSQAAAA